MMLVMVMVKNMIHVQLVFARWRIDEILIIGNGAFCAVHNYKATNVHGKTTVAVKFAIKNKGSLKDEVKHLHPNVIGLYEYVDRYAKYSKRSKAPNLPGILIDETKLNCYNNNNDNNHNSCFNCSRTKR